MPGKFINSILPEIRQHLRSENDEQAGLLLLRAFKGLPKNKAMIKLLSEEGNKSLMRKTENFYMQDNSKNMFTVTDDLFFVIDEKNNSIEMTDKGLDLITTSSDDADFFILPSRKLEGFGLVTPESLACGTPVLGTPVGGTREILSGFAPDFLFRDTSPEAMVQGIQKAIARFFPNSQRYERLRYRCREYAEKSYSWQRHTNQLESILDELVTGKNNASGKNR